ncbi:MAG: NUDIX domain-containing protein [Acholeplasmataceae bacterium]|nr:NUDIX domain-containing protein [Acholeplasmataceae bacterium]
MISFGKMIVEEGLVSKGKIKDRFTVRAIIKNQKNELLMVYSNLFDDYTFPGGGINPNESQIDALQRELKEEIGAVSIKIIQPCGTTKEMRYGVKGSDQVYMQTSVYYLCEILEFGDQELQGRELIHGIEPKWVNLDDAIKKNESVIKDDLHQKKGLKTVLIRENAVLKKLKEIGLCEDLKS